MAGGWEGWYEALLNEFSLGIGERQMTREQGIKAGGTQGSIRLPEQNDSLTDQVTGVKLPVKIYLIQSLRRLGADAYVLYGGGRQNCGRAGEPSRVELTEPCLSRREDGDGAVGGLGLVVWGAVGDDDVGFAAGL